MSLKKEGDLSTINYFSATSLNLYLDCPRCFYLHYKGITRPTLPPSSLLLKFDAELKNHFDRYRPELPPELKGISGKLVDFELIEKFRNIRKPLTVYLPELDVNISGALDDCLIKKKVFYCPVEFKVKGKFDESEAVNSFISNQLDIYTLILEKLSFMTKRVAFLIVYVMENFHLVNENGLAQFKVKVIKVPTSPERAVGLIKKAKECLLSEEPPQPKENCIYCKYRNS
jgi:hypothetical protein